MARSTLGRGPTIALLALVILAYLPAWPGGFLVEDWTFLRRYREWSVAETVAFELGRPLRDRAWVERERPDFFTAALWRPIPYILAHVEQRAFDDWTGGWFLTRLVCHAGTAWLFAAAVLAWTRKRDLAWLAGAIYGLHPSRFYPLLVMCQSQMLLAALGLVLAAWGLGVWRTGRRTSGSCAVLVGASLACWSYEQAVAALVLLPVLDAAWPALDGSRPARTDALRRAVPLVAVVVVYAVLRVIRFEGLGGYSSVSDAEQLFDPAHPLRLLAGTATATAGALLSLAAPLSRQDWPVLAAGRLQHPAVVIGLNAAVVLLTGVCTVRAARGHRRAVLFGAATLVAFVAWTTLPIAGLLKGHDPWNRYIYFPGMAWVVVLAWAFTPQGTGRWRRVPAAAALGCGLLVAWGGCHVWRAAWRQADGLHDAIVAQVPGDGMSYIYLDGFSEWVGGRNLFIRNLTGPIDIGVAARKLRLWPSRWRGPASVQIPASTAWPFERPPWVRLGRWNASLASLQLEELGGYRPGTHGDRLRWDLTRTGGRRAWTPDSLLAPMRGGEAGIHVQVRTPFAAITSPPLMDIPWTPAVLGVEMAVAGPPDRPDWMEILFYSAAQPIASGTHLLRVATHADGRPHRYVVSLLDHPAPAVDGPLTRIALRPSRHTGAQVVIRDLWLAAAGAELPPEWAQSNAADKGP